MKNLPKILGIILIAATAGYLGAQFNPPSAPAAAKQESTYERVMRTGEIRCGYVVWPPMFNKDPNSGQYSGIFYDYMEEMGKLLHMKIIWSEEIQFGTFLEDLKNQRYDVECTGGWPNAQRGKFADYTNPVFYIVIAAFVRDGDTRFDNNLAALNDPAIRIAMIEGENSQDIWRADFPKAQAVGLPGTTSPIDMLMNVATQKADATFTDLVTGFQFIAQNPGKIRLVPTAKPLRYIANNFTIRQNEPNLKGMLNQVNEELLGSGTVDKILDKYEQWPGTFYRLAYPFRQ
ncbi:MAG: substrate-binding periplasmic protein [Dongiaceae bacterium]